MEEGKRKCDATNEADQQRERELERERERERDWPPSRLPDGKFYPFLSLDCARVEGVGEQSKERKG